MAKLLLVEDDNNLREIYAARLEAEGYEIATAADGESALATAVKEKPDLIILDVMMPKISGFDVLDILRSTPETKDAKIVMMTALSQASDRERGEQLGANKYLVKSQVTLEDVVANVQELLAQKAAAPAPTTPVETTPADAPMNVPDLPIENVDATQAAPTQVNAPTTDTAAPAADPVSQAQPTDEPSGDTTAGSTQADTPTSDAAASDSVAAPVAASTEPAQAATPGSVIEPTESEQQ